MASIIKTSINLDAIPKDKIIIGKKGKYLPLTFTLNEAQNQKNRLSSKKGLVPQQEREFQDIKRKQHVIYAGLEVYILLKC